MFYLLRGGSFLCCLQPTHLQLVCCLLGWLSYSISGRHWPAGMVPEMEQEGEKVYPAPLASHEDVVRCPALFMDSLRRFHSLLGIRFMYVRERSFFFIPLVCVCS